MITITYCLAVIFFCTAFYFTHMLTTCNQIITIAKTSVTTITDKNLDDAIKEKATQAAAVNMLKRSFFLLIKLAIIFCATVLPLWLADLAGLASFSDTSNFSLRIDVLLITTIIVTLIAFFWRKLLSK